MMYLMTHSKHFIYSYMASDCKKEANCLLTGIDLNPTACQTDAQFPGLWLCRAINAYATTCVCVSVFAVIRAIPCINK